MKNTKNYEVDHFKKMVGTLQYDSRMGDCVDRCVVCVCVCVACLSVCCRGCRVVRIYMASPNPSMSLRGLVSKPHRFSRPTNQRPGPKPLASTVNPNTR